MQSYHSQEDEDKASDGADSDWLESSDNDQIEDTKVAGKEEGQMTLSMAEKETEKVQRKMYDDGYREGIGLGKEGAIQQGFDHGFKMNGAPIGRRLGKLKGTLHALEIRLIQSRPSEEVIETKDTILKSLQTIRKRVNNLQLKDLMEPDWEAIEHERQHGGQVDHIKHETLEQKSKRENILNDLECEFEHENYIHRCILRKTGPPEDRRPASNIDACQFLEDRRPASNIDACQFLEDRRPASNIDAYQFLEDRRPASNIDAYQVTDISTSK